MTLTMERHHAQSILEGKKIYEARYLTDSGPKLKGLEAHSKIACHWYQKERLVATTSEILTYDSIPTMLAALGTENLLPGMDQAAPRSSERAQCLATTNFSRRFPIFETSATALCGTTGLL